MGREAPTLTDGPPRPSDGVGGEKRTPVTGLSVAGASSLAHGIHYSVLGIGLLGLVALLAPRRTTTRAGGSTDAHAVRVAELRRVLEAGRLDVATATRAPARTLQLWLPLAVVSTTAAAGVHAAVGPAHFREQTLFGLFFAAAALAQVVWSAAAAVHVSPGMLRLAAFGNAGLVALWLTTRTVGIPGLLPHAEQVGAWDLACVVWEVAAVVACVRAVGSHLPDRLPAWSGWDRRVQLWAVVSVVGLGLLSISGAGS